MSRDSRNLFLATLYVEHYGSGGPFRTDVWVVGKDFDDARQKAKPWCGFHTFKIEALVDKGRVIP